MRQVTTTCVHSQRDIECVLWWFWESQVMIEVAVDLKQRKTD